MVAYFSIAVCNHYGAYWCTVGVAGLGISVSSVATASHESKSLHDGQASKDGPDEVTECDSSLGGLALGVSMAVRNTDVSSDSGSAGKPEERGKSEDAEGDHVVVDARSKERRQGEVEKHENGPDGTEE
ncbi:hypothetical protein HG531_004453 [Fusarium graminearum]|nr:hypothetical protein HG531_004453 [Fusarium graminearum]